MIPRVHERRRVLWDGKLHTDGEVLECQVLAISAGGARVRIPSALSIGGCVLLFIPLLGSFPGVVRWQRERQAGISFLEAAEAIQERLTRSADLPAKADSTCAAGVTR